MFAVPGWNLASKVLVQEQPKPVKDKSKSSTPNFSAPHERAANPEKRKRDQSHQKQGPEASSQSQDRLRNSRPALPSNKKHKTQLHESRAQTTRRDRNGKQAYGKGPGKSSSTGANSEPVAAVGGQRAREARAEVQKPQPKKTNRDTTNESTSPHSDAAEPATEKDASQSLPPIVPLAPAIGLTPLQAKMRAKLTSARFRHLNETLYTTSSSDALNLFTNSPDLFDEYHAGFSQQVRDSWPQNPVEVYIKSIVSRGRSSSPVNGVLPLPRRKPGLCTIADLGCGDAPLARGLLSVIKKLNLKLHNFDLHTTNSHVTKADISALPLQDGEVDIAIFCLSLMGTNWLSFVEEAWRVLRGDGKGEIWVAEVKSRFGRLSARQGPRKVVDNSVGKRRKPQVGEKSHTNDNAGDNPILVEDERQADKPGAEDDTDLQPFIDSFQRRGFMLRDGSVDKSNKMFVSMIFAKTGVPRAGKWAGMKWNGREYERMEERKGVQQRRSQGGPRLLAKEEEVDDKEEGKLLKPCVYKLR